MIYYLKKLLQSWITNSNTTVFMSREIIVCLFWSEHVFSVSKVHFFFFAALGLCCWAWALSVVWAGLPLLQCSGFSKDALGPIVCFSGTPIDQISTIFHIPNGSLLLITFPSANNFILKVSILNKYPPNLMCRNI